MNVSRLIFIAVACFCSANSVSATVTIQQLTEMTEAKHPEYRVLRDVIVAQGETILPELDRIYGDQSLNWKPRFAAGVCIEHIRRENDIQKFLNHNWWNEPGFCDAGPILATGYPRDCFPIVQKVEEKYGLWFYYLELFANKIIAYEETTNYRIIGRVSAAILGCQDPDIRYFGSRIVELLFNDNAFSQKRIDGQTEIYLKELISYVDDRTYPEGKATIYNHLDSYGLTIRTFFAKETDVQILSRLQIKYEGNPYVSELIRRQFKIIEAGTDAPSPLSVKRHGMDMIISSKNPSPEVISTPVDEKKSSEDSINVFKISIVCIMFLPVFILVLFYYCAGHR